MTEMTAAEAAEMFGMELSAALSLGFLAADFVRQPETMPVFKEWVRTVVSPANPSLDYFTARLDAENAAQLTGVLMELMLGVQK